MPSPLTSASPSNVQQPALDSSIAMSTTTVGFGESALAHVAQRVGVTPAVLHEANPQIADPENLTMGQSINLPSCRLAPPPAPAAPSPAPARRMESLGVFQIDMKGGVRTVLEKDVLGATRPPDAVVRTARDGDNVLVAHELKRGPHLAMLLTRFEGTAAEMRTTQSLYRYDGYADSWLDVTKEASRAGSLAVDWNMPQLPRGFKLPGMGETAGRMAAETLIGQIPPSLVIPHVKDSILADHFEFTLPGQNPYQNFSDRIARRWSATGERKLDYFANQGAAAVGGVNELAAGVASVGRQVAGSGIKAAGEVAQDTAKATSAAQSASTGAARGINWSPFRAPSLDNLLPRTAAIPAAPHYPNGAIGEAVDFLELTPPTGGGRIYASTAPVNHFHVDDLVLDLTGGGRLARPDKTVHVLSGRHGNRDGFDLGTKDTEFFHQDFSLAPHAKNVEIHDVTKMTPAQIKAVMTSGDDVVLAWCYSENSRQVMRALGLDFVVAPF